MSDIERRNDSSASPAAELMLSSVKMCVLIYIYTMITIIWKSKSRVGSQVPWSELCPYNNPRPLLQPLMFIIMKVGGVGATFQYGVVVTVGGYKGRHGQNQSCPCKWNCLPLMQILLRFILINVKLVLLGVFQFLMSLAALPAKSLENNGCYSESIHRK